MMTSGNYFFIEHFSNLAGWPAFLLHVWLKGGLLLMAGALLVLALRRASAATRHWVWTLGLCGILLLPVLAAVLPSWPVPWMPALLNTSPTSSGVLPANEPADKAAPLPEAGTGAGLEAIQTGQPVVTTKGSTEQLSASPALSTHPQWPYWLALVWISGGLLLVTSIGAGILAIRRLAARATPANADLWAEPLVEICEAMDVKPNISLLQSEQVKVPMVWGWRRPVLLLPAEADQWPEARRRMVLLHEIAHLKRGDCLTQLVARVACAVYWFNPLVWLAAWRMRVERERACDDMVLNAGSKASDYADELLQITTGLPTRRFSAGTAIAMARRSTLEGRLLAILDKTRNRHAITHWAVATSTLLLACLIVPVAMLRGGEQSSASLPRERHFVRLVIGESSLTFQGQPTTWEQLPQLMAAIKDREHTVLEVATETDNLTLAQFNPLHSRAGALSQQFGFEYLSLIGVQPLESKGSSSMPVGGGTEKVAPALSGEAEDQQWKQKLNEEQRQVLEWTERSFRSYFDRRTFAGHTEQERAALETRLLDALKGPVNREYYEAISTLAALRSQKAVSPLLAIATDRGEKNNRDRWMATRALGIIGDRSVVPELIHLVYYPNLNSRWWGQIALVQLTGVNFGKDWEAWGRWWKEQGNNPPFQPEKVAWSPGHPEWTDAQTIEEGDQKWMDDLNGIKKPGAAQPGGLKP